MINLQALESALAAVEDVGKGEHSFTIHGTSFTLRVLIPEEEVEVQKYAAGALKGGDEDEQHTAMSFMDRFQTGLLSHAIIQINELDLRAEKFVETGEVLPNGKAVKIPKSEALQGLIKGWGRHLLTGVFRKYAELLAKVEKDAEDAIEFEPVDIDAEIDRLEERLEEMREAKRQQEAGPQRGVFSDRVQRMADFNLAADQERRDNIATMETGSAQEPEDEEGFVPFVPEQADPEPEQPRRTAIPHSAAPPQQAPTPKSEGSVDMLPQVQESLVDSGDMDSMAAAVAAENARLVRRRTQAGMPLHNVAMASPSNPDGSALTAARQAGAIRRPPPHLAARQTDHTVRPQEQLTEAINEQQRHTQVGTLGDRPVFRPEAPEVLGTPSSTPPVEGRKAVLNPKQGGSRNPRFRGGQ